MLANKCPYLTVEKVKKICWKFMNVHLCTCGAVTWRWIMFSFLCSPVCCSLFFFFKHKCNNPLLYSWMKYALFASCQLWLAFPPFKVTSGTVDPVWGTVTWREHGIWHVVLFTPGIPDGGFLLETEVEARWSACPGTETQQWRKEEPIVWGQLQHRSTFQAGVKR